MKRRRWIVVVLAAAAAVTAVALFATVGTARSARPKIVNLHDNYYTPAKVKVKKGHKVKWSWKNVIIEHNVTLKTAPKGVKKSKFRSQTSSSPSYRFTRKFTRPGKYHFICTIHPVEMQMNVVVHR